MLRRLADGWNGVCGGENAIEVAPHQTKASDALGRDKRTKGAEKPVIYENNIFQ